MNVQSRIFGTDLPKMLDQIIKRVRRECKISDLSELKEHLRSKQGSDKTVIVVELDKEFPKWKTMTSSKDPEKYIVQKMSYRVDRMD